jgi:hypothetical protein
VVEQNDKTPKNLGISVHPTETVINRRSSKGPLKERNKAGRGDMINGRQERHQDTMYKTETERVLCV